MESKEYISGVFSRNAAAYRNRLEEALRKGEAAGRDAILDYLRVRPGMHVLDLACGPGTLSIPMARELSGNGEVIGVDLAEGMLETGRSAVAGRSLPLRFLRMDIENLQFPPATFDAVSCGHGLHFVPNLGRALREARRVLKPRCRFCASIPPADGMDPGPAQVAFAKAFNARLGPSRPPPGLEATRALVGDLGRFRAAALQAGFRYAETEQLTVQTTWADAGHFVDVNASWWANASRLEGLSDHVRQLVLAEALEAVKGVVGEGPITAPSTANVLKAEA